MKINTTMSSATLYRLLRPTQCFFNIEDLLTELIQYLPVVDVITLCRSSSTAFRRRYALLRRKHISFLRPFLPYSEVLDFMRCTNLCIFDESSWKFLNNDEHEWTDMSLIVLAVGHRFATSTIQFMRQQGFHTIPLASISDRSNQLQLNPFISNIIAYRSRERTIVLCISKCDSVFKCAMGASTTSFMNLIGADHIWMAYPSWTLHLLSVRNPLYYHGPVPPHFARNIAYATAIVKNCSFTEYLLYWRILVERPHLGFCAIHPECPQAPRFSNDSSCLSIIFAPDDVKRSSAELLTIASFNDHHIMWRLGGRCYEKTIGMSPIVIAVPGLDIAFSDD